MGFPDSDKSTSDALDFLTDACSEIIDVEQDGRVIKQQILNTQKVYYKTQNVNSPYFSRFVLELEKFKLLATQAPNYMSKSRAIVLAGQILGYYATYQLSIDAKSSESIRDRLNNQPTLLDRLLSNKTERAITLKGELKKSFFAGMLGKDEEDRSLN